jgi:MFS transporter, OFA family, oxalate/formate antiporter
VIFDPEAASRQRGLFFSPFALNEHVRSMNASTTTDSPDNKTSSPALPNRWIIVLAGVWLQLFLGTVYAWSDFQKPLVEKYGWANTNVTWTFSLAICFLGLAAAWGGMKLPKYGPQKLASIGGVLFGAGYLLAAAALRWHSLALLYMGYGVVGGTGLGLGYVTPVATVAKWFPDRKGLATGMVIMGFGLGAALMSKLIAPALCNWSDGNLVSVFACLGVVFMAATVFGASLLRNPPPGYVPPCSAPPGGRHGHAGMATQHSSENISTASVSMAPADPPAAVQIVSLRFATMWMIFFCNIVAGISIISLQSPIFQDLWRLADPLLSKESLASYGGSLIAVSALFNGVGRMFWGGLSDRIGRLHSFRLMLASQLAAFLLLIVTGNPWLFGAMICYVLLCYGGGFGTMPSFILDVFGSKRMATAYGIVLTAWSAAGIVGPQIFAFLKDHCAERAATYSFFAAAGFLAIGLLLSLALRRQPAA